MGKAARADKVRGSKGSRGAGSRPSLPQRLMELTVLTEALTWLSLHAEAGVCLGLHQQPPMPCRKCELLGVWEAVGGTEGAQCEAEASG